MFKKNYPAAWMFHKNTERSATTLLYLDERKIPEMSFKEYLQNPVIELQTPLPTQANFEDVLFKRKSCRVFSEEPLSLKTLSTALYYGYGVKNNTTINGIEMLERFVPSSGGLYSLELYLIVKNVQSLNPGIYHYLPLNHTLELLHRFAFPSHFITGLFLDQPYIAGAGVFIIACSMLNRCMQKYEDRGYRYILFEAGHVFQNINLCAAGLDIGALNIGGFYDADMIQLLGLDQEQEVPLYALALGEVDKNYTGDIRGAF